MHINSLVIEEMTVEDKQLLIRGFRALDVDNSGTVDKDEIFQYLRNSGLDIKEAKIKSDAMMKMMDPDNKGKISLKDYMRAKISTKVNDNIIERVRTLSDRDETGQMDVDLNKVQINIHLQSVGPASVAVFEDTPTGNNAKNFDDKELNAKIDTMPGLSGNFQYKSKNDGDSPAKGPNGLNLNNVQTSNSLSPNDIQTKQPNMDKNAQSATLDFDFDGLLQGLDGDSIDLGK